MSKKAQKKLNKLSTHSIHILTNIDISDDREAL